MFTGIIARTARISSIEELAGGKAIEVELGKIGAGLAAGDSVAVDGCCLTVTRLASAPGCGTRFELSKESLDRTVATTYRAGSVVNIEPSLRMGDKLGGHLVTGHVDCVGRVARLDREGAFATLGIEVTVAPAGMIAEKGSVTVNGVSLTVASWSPGNRGGVFTAALIPETLERTNLSAVIPGSRVNIEFDLLARYVVEALAGR